MEKRESYIADELALAKSAAWAWLEHCSGSDDRTTPEFAVSRTKFNPKPSRYKMEAMKRTSSNSMNGPLLDRYEIERISRQLEFCIKSSHHGGGRRAAEDIKRKKKKKKKMSKGTFSLLVLHAVACGSSMNDEAAAYSRRPENDSVAVVEVGCQPWQGIRAQSSGVA